MTKNASNQAGAMREAFEEYIHREYGPGEYTTLALQKNELGTYSTTWVNNQWIGWKASLASRAATVSDTVELLLSKVPVPPSAITYEKGWELLDELQRIATARAASSGG